MMVGRKADFIDKDAAMEDRGGYKSNRLVDDERLAC